MWNVWSYSRQLLKVQPSKASLNLFLLLFFVLILIFFFFLVGVCQNHVLCHHSCNHFYESLYSVPKHDILQLLSHSSSFFFFIKSLLSIIFPLNQPSSIFILPSGLTFKLQLKNLLHKSLEISQPKDKWYPYYFFLFPMRSLFLIASQAIYHYLLTD